MTVNNFKPRIIRSFSGRQGRGLNDEQQQQFQSSLEVAAIRISDDKIQIDPKKLFVHNPEQIWLEIGFGTGDFLSTQSSNNQQYGFIGCEPFLRGVAHLLNKIADHEVQNVRVWTYDARILLEKLMPNSIDKVFILFPDPWPKVKHHKRRLIQHDFLTLLAEKLKINGELVLATDHTDYMQWIMRKIETHPSFDWIAKENIHTPPSGWVKTKYQSKAEELSLKPYFLYAINKG